MQHWEFTLNSGAEVEFEVVSRNAVPVDVLILKPEEKEHYAKGDNAIFVVGKQNATAVTGTGEIPEGGDYSLIISPCGWNDAEVDVDVEMK